MATYKLRHFSQMELLKRLNRENLLRFLSPFRDFFAEQNVLLPLTESRQRIDYEQLIGVLLSPAGYLPKDLVEALYFVDALSHPKGQEVLLAALPGLDFIAWDTPADVAVKAWMLDRDVVEQLQAEGTAFSRSRSYESYLAPANVSRSWATPTPTIIESIERELEAWFLSRKRGRGTRVFPSVREGGFGFLVRHGEAYRREGTLKKGRSSSIVYRPEKYDVLEFDPTIGEMRIHARSKMDKTIYREIFARHLLGDGQEFSERTKYTLEPLKIYGPAALACHDVSDLAWAKLVEIEWGDDQNPREYIRYRCKDLLESFEKDGRQIPFYAELLIAKFEIRLMHNRKPRKVTIVPPNTIRLTRDDDGLLVEQWLHNRGFINIERKDEWDEDSPLLESA